eukprot:UC1_evm1s1986
MTHSPGDSELLLPDSESCSSSSRADSPPENNNVSSPPPISLSTAAKDSDFGSLGFGDELYEVPQDTITSPLGLKNASTSSSGCMPASSPPPPPRARAGTRGSSKNRLSALDPGALAGEALSDMEGLSHCLASLSRPEFHDAVFICGADGSERVGCVRALMASRSHVLQRMLYPPPSRAEGDRQNGIKNTTNCGSSKDSAGILTPPASKGGRRSSGTTSSSRRERKCSSSKKSSVNHGMSSSNGMTTKKKREIFKAGCHDGHDNTFGGVENTFAHHHGQLYHQHQQHRQHQQQYAICVHMPEFGSDTMRLIREFCQTGRCTLRADTILGVANAADRFALPALRDACAEFVQRCIALDTVVPLLQGCGKHIHYKSTKALLRAVLEYCENAAEEVLQLPELTDLPQHVMRLLLARELRAPEIHKFEAALRWSRAHAAANPSAGGGRPLKDIMAPLIEWVAFYKVDAAALMRIVKPSLTVSDEIIMTALAYQADPSSVDPEDMRLYPGNHRYSSAGNSIISGVGNSSSGITPEHERPVTEA